MPFPQSNTEYRAWLLDLDGTLYSARGVKLAMALELLLAGGWSAIPVLRKFRKMHEILRSAATDDLVDRLHRVPSSESDEATLQPSPYRRQLEATAQAVGASLAVVERVVQRWMFERPAKWIGVFRNRKLLSQIRAFRAQGGKTALVSDYPARRKLEALGAQDLFDVVIASGECVELRALKPASDGYRLAATLLGVDANECLVIGDREDADGEAARRAGMSFLKIV